MSLEHGVRMLGHAGHWWAVGYTLADIGGRRKGVSYVWPDVIDTQWEVQRAILPRPFSVRAGNDIVPVGRFLGGRSPERGRGYSVRVRVVSVIGLGSQHGWHVDEIAHSPCGPSHSLQVYDHRKV